MNYWLFEGDGLKLIFISDGHVYSYWGMPSRLKGKMIYSFDGDDYHEVHPILSACRKLETYEVIAYRMLGYINGQIN